MKLMTLKMPLGSKVDRHEHIEQGEIRISCLRMYILTL